jgi:RNA polymerase sigma-70 factor (ECF subfamily)
MDTDERGERDAVTALQRGDINGLDTLVRRYQLPAVRVVFGIVNDRAAAEDIVAEAFVIAFTRIGQFDPRRPFAPWFYRIVVNDALKFLRRQRRTRPSDNGAEAAMCCVDRDADPETVTLRREVREEIASAIQALPPPQRAAVVLHYYLEMGDTAIAATLGCPRGTVKWRLHAARRRLREALDAYSPQGGAR